MQLWDGRQKATESLPSYGRTSVVLPIWPIPVPPSDVRDTLAKEQFVDALTNSEMRLKVKQSRPTCLNDDVWLAVELEAFY